MLKAENNIGNVRKHKGIQIKRHRNQMNEKGLKILAEWFGKLDISKTTISEHLLNKETISFKKQDIYDLLHKATGEIKNMIIEYNKTDLKDGQKLDSRIILRDDKILQTDKGEQNLCIVLSLTQNMVVTLWYNPPKDKHKTIDMSEYCPYSLDGI